MKSLIKFITLLLVLAPLAGCRSSKQAAAAGQKIEQEEATWTNVTVPVKIQVTSPQRMSLSGTATMVRGEYILLSLRFLGFEVGRACLTPEEADLVLKQPSRLWIHEPTGDRLTRGGISFAALQQVLLGDRSLLDRLPKGVDVTVGGTEDRPAVTFRSKLKGKNVEATLSWELDRAKWDQPAPPRFEQPGSDYSQTTLEQFARRMGVIK